MLEEVPEELRVTPERDERLIAQAQALAGTDIVRLLDLVSAALEATANGAQARIQLELVLIKATAPEVDPSAAALLARIERLEAALAGARPAPAPPSRPAPKANGGDPAPRAAAPERQAPPPSVSQSPPAVSEPAPAPAVSTPPPDPEPVAAPGPEPVAAPATEAARAAAGPPELATVAACWPAVIDLVRKDNQMLAALLADARPVALSDQDVTVAFPAGKAFLKRKAEQDDYRRATAEALRSVTGAALVLRYELRDEEEMPEPADAGGLSHEELVKRLVEEFDAQEVLDDDEESEN
jgi:DNA polymerase III gamma/tau subunit